MTTRLWVVPGAILALAGAGWLREPSEPYLVVCAVATVAAAILATRAGAGRRWAMALAAIGASFCIIGGFAQRELTRVSSHWEEYRAARAAQGEAALIEALEQATGSLERTASAALDVPSSPEGAFAALESALRSAGPAERGVVVYEGDRPLAWAGLTRVPTDSLRSPVGVVDSDFYLVLYASASRGSRRAVATVLVHATPPGDRLSTPLDAVVARRAAVSGFQFTAIAPSSGDLAGAVRDVVVRGDTLVRFRSEPMVPREVELRTREAAQARGGALLAAAIVVLLIGGWRHPTRFRWRALSLAVALATVAIVPLNSAFSNATSVFDPTYYFAPLGGPLTASVGALALTASLVLLAILALLRSRARLRSRWPAIGGVVVVAGLGPFLLRDLARGITPPARGVPAELWIGWEVALFLAASAILLAGISAGRAALGARRGVAPMIAPGVTAITSLLAPLLWEAPGRWPAWYPALWIISIASLAFARRSRWFVLNAALVAGFGAATLVWGATARRRVQLAERDVQGLEVPDPFARTLLERFGEDLARLPAPADRAELLRRYVGSDLEAAGYPVELAVWKPTAATPEVPDIVLVLSEFEQRTVDVAPMVAQARLTGGPIIRQQLGDAGLNLLVAVPHDQGTVTTVAVAPRTRLIADDPFIALIGLAPGSSVEPPYTLTLVTDGGSRVLPHVARWQRIGDELHGDWLITTAAGPTRAHVEVELRSLPALVQRGSLLVLLDLVVITALWTLSASAGGAVPRWARARVTRWARSYRARLTLALFAFFVLPAVSFAIWSYRRLQSDDRQSRELLVRETLRTIAEPDRSGRGATGGDRSAASGLGDRSAVGVPLFVYRDGALRGTSDSLYEGLAPVGRFLRKDVMLTVGLADEVTSSFREMVAGLPTLFGYRAATGPNNERVLLGAPARSGELALDRQRRDLGILVLFATAVGAIGALTLSGLAARQLSRPIGSLQRAASAIARGEREPTLSEAPPAEFQQVFSTFQRMAKDLAESEQELNEARRRTEAVLRNVASGVIGIDVQGKVTLANPRAELLLGRPLPPGTPISDLEREAQGLAERVRAFIAEGRDEEEEFDLEIGGRQLHGRLTRLTTGAVGAVLTLDDLTELARAQRVLAWGEMARQVAHEIKNPLTPIRLGVQHLKRARRDGRVDFDRVLDQNVERILNEIDRLDEIARAFSRYGMMPAERVPGRPVNVASIVRDVVELERLGESGVNWQMSGVDDDVWALANAEELREVLLNVLENARHAGATDVSVRLSTDAEPPAGDDGDGTHSGGRVVIEVRDNGHGIAPEVLPRIFEPHFSTRTSGSGLGLPISRTLVDGWGGEIAVASEPRRGTTVTIELASAPPP